MKVSFGCAAQLLPKFPGVHAGYFKIEISLLPQNVCDSPLSHEMNLVKKLLASIAKFLVHDNCRGGEV